MAGENELLEILKNSNAKLRFIQLAGHIKNNNSLIMRDFDNRKTIFHLLAESKAFDFLMHLLNYIEAPLINRALLKDYKGKTILHYCLDQPEVSQEFLSYICKKLPTLVNEKDNIGQLPLHYGAITGDVASLDRLIKANNANVNIKDEFGNTPLHYAVISGNIKAISILQAVPGLRYDLKNKKGDSVISLAKNNPDILAVLGARNLSVPTLENLNKLSKEFSIMPSSARKTSPTSVQALNEEKRRLTPRNETYSPRKKAEKTQDKQKQKQMSEDGLVDALNQYTKIAATVNYVQDREAQLKEMFRYFQTLCLEQYFQQDSKFRLFIISLKTRPWILTDILSMLSAEIQQQYENLTHKLDALVDECTLRIHSIELSGEKSSLDTIPLSRLSKKEDFTLKDLFTYIIQNETTVEDGLLKAVLLTYNFEACLLELANLMGVLSPEERGIVYYIVFKMTLLQLTAFESSLDKLKIQVSVIRQLSKLYELPDTFNEIFIDSFFDRFFKFGAEFFNQQLLKNYNFLLNKQVQKTENLLNFDALIDEALKKPSHTREVHILKVVHELRCQSQLFYKKTSLCELYAYCFSKAKEPLKKTEALEAEAMRINRLANYFVAKIFEKNHADGVEGLKNAVIFMIQLATYLCPVEQGAYPDLNSVLMIAGVLGDASISRLFTLFELGKEYSAMYKKIEQIVDPVGNYKNLNNIYDSIVHSIPYIGQTKSELIRIADKTEHFYKQLHLFAKATEGLQKIYRTSAFLFLSPFSSIDTVIHSKYPMMSEDDKWEKSLVIRPLRTGRSASVYKSGSSGSLKLFSRKKTDSPRSWANKSSDSSSEGFSIVSSTP